jgi:hypothetical protein
MCRFMRLYRQPGPRPTAGVADARADIRPHEDVSAIGIPDSQLDHAIKATAEPMQSPRKDTPTSREQVSRGLLVAARIRSGTKRQLD